MHKWQKLNRGLILIVFYSLLIVCIFAPNGFAAAEQVQSPETAQALVEPFMVAPWGTLRDDVIALVKLQDPESRSDIFTKDFMGMPAEIHHYFSNKLTKDELQMIEVKCIKENVSFAEAEEIINLATDYVKSRLRSPVSRRVTEEYNSISLVQSNDNVVVFKDYIIDDKTAVLMFYQWRENEGKLEAWFYFSDRYTRELVYYSAYERIINEQPELNYGYDLESGKPLLTAERTPFVYNDWTLNAAELRELKGAPYSGLSRYLTYKDTVWGVPAETNVRFERDGFWFGYPHMVSYTTFFEVYGLDLAQAQSVTMAMVLSLNAAMMQNSRWREIVHFSHSAFGKVSWRSGYRMYDDKTYLFATFRWNENYGNYYVYITLSDIEYEKEWAEINPADFQDTPLDSLISAENGGTE